MEKITNSTFFLISTMVSEPFDQIYFKKDKKFDDFNSCVKYITEAIDWHLKMRFSVDDLKNFNIPTTDQIKQSLIEDSYICYIFGEGSSEYKMVFHMSKIEFEMRMQFLKTDKDK